MRLIRYDESYTADPDNPVNYWRDEFEIEETDDDDELKIEFKQFGRGPDKKPHFAVKVSWIDVQAFIEAFIEKGDDNALYLQRLIKLAVAIEEAGWSPEEPPQKEIFDLLSP